MIKNKKIIILQFVFLFVVLLVIFALYPRVNPKISGSFLRFESFNADYIVLSQSKDFYEAKYFSLKDINNNSLILNPGKYYWKAYNNYIEGFSGEFEIDTEVSLAIENNSDLINAGNVKINITKSKDGKMVGKIILDKHDKIILDKESKEYKGVQNE